MFQLVCGRLSVLEIERTSDRLLMPMFRNHKTVQDTPKFRGLVGRKLVEPPPPSQLAVPWQLLYFGSLVILDVARCYLSLFSLYINMK